MDPFEIADICDQVIPNQEEIEGWDCVGFFHAVFQWSYFPLKVDCESHFNTKRCEKCKIFLERIRLLPKYPERGIFFVLGRSPSGQLSNLVGFRYDPDTRQTSVLNSLSTDNLTEETFKTFRSEARKLGMKPMGQRVCVVQ